MLHLTVKEAIERFRTTNVDQLAALFRQPPETLTVCQLLEKFNRLPECKKPDFSSKFWDDCYGDAGMVEITIGNSTILIGVATRYAEIATPTTSRMDIKLYLFKPEHFKTHFIQ